MAVYKVPQDVEADDKLIGPFSFRQFIYLIIVAASLGIGWVLSQIFIGLAIIVLPIILFFGALALPLRKDQPMETYLAALVSFYLKPHKRLWEPDGLQSLIEITAPKTVEDPHRTKDLSQQEADRRLTYLADIVDSQGWAVRGSSGLAETRSSMNADMYYEAQHTEDIMDTSTRQSRNIGSRIAAANQQNRQQVASRMQQHIARPQQPQQFPQPIPQPQPQQYVQQPGYPAQQPMQQMQYPQQMAQPYYQPSPQPPQNQSQYMPQSTSNNAPSPDIIDLANNPDLSVQTIANEARRREQR